MTSDDPKVSKSEWNARGARRRYQLQRTHTWEGEVFSATGLLLARGRLRVTKRLSVRAFHRYLVAREGRCAGACRGPRPIAMGRTH
jgi:hypothetical protein